MLMAESIPCFRSQSWKNARPSDVKTTDTVSVALSISSRENTVNAFLGQGNRRDATMAPRHRGKIALPAGLAGAVIQHVYRASQEFGPSDRKRQARENTKHTPFWCDCALRFTIRRAA